jgi:hypothetical protein
MVRYDVRKLPREDPLLMSQFLIKTFKLFYLPIFSPDEGYSKKRVVCAK